MSFIVRALLSLSPVIVFLLVLIFLDSFKIVRRNMIFAALAVGLFMAIVCYFLNGYIANLIDTSPEIFSRYVAPIVEETCKSAFLVLLLRQKRIGFAVDAAIYGFAVGAGFALAENVYYLQKLGEVSPLAWIVRGFGTAAMHGGTVCLFGIVGQTLSDRWEKAGLASLLPGFLLAVLIHSAYNHFVLPPVMSTALLLLTFPPIIGLVFVQSERATQRWLGTGLDSDMELLDLIVSGRVSHTHIGTYLENLRHRFPAETVVDMLCYLRLHLELALQAKGLLMMRQAGLPVPPDPELESQFTELRHLERSIGTIGKLAIAPFLRSSRQDIWQIYMLAQEQRGRG